MFCSRHVSNHAGTHTLKLKEGGNDKKCLSGRCQALNIIILNVPMYVGGLTNCYHQMMTQMCEREKFLCNQLSPSGGVLQCVVSKRAVNKISRNIYLRRPYIIGSSLWWNHLLALSQSRIYEYFMLNGHWLEEVFSTLRSAKILKCWPDHL